MLNLVFCDWKYIFGLQIQEVLWPAAHRRTAFYFKFGKHTLITMQQQVNGKLIIYPIIFKGA